MAAPSQPALIGLDWGTSSLRGYLVANDGGILDAAARPWGIQHLPDGGFPAAFRGITDPWRGRGPAVPIVAAGMVGSRQGWREVPYVDCPADAAAIAGGMVTHRAEAAVIHLVPGLIRRGPLPNVLRGEETQIVGAFAREPAPARESLVVLPGTHSKWVSVREGRIVDFETFMTGELFGVLRDHSLLGRPFRDAAGRGSEADDPGGRQAAFDRGVATARDAGSAGIAGRLFSTRSLFLTDQLGPAATLDYLSGLLVGEEVRSALAARGAARLPPVVLVGDATLTARYRDALAAFGIDRIRTVGDDAAAAGLWRIAAAAGIVPMDSRSPRPTPVDPPAPEHRA